MRTLAIEKVITPLGGAIEIHGSTPEDISDKVRDVVVPYWDDYCSAHWLSSNHEDLLCPERRVKAFLDRCGTLMLFGLPGIETRYKEIVHQVREIPMSDCPHPMRNSLYAGKVAPDDPSVSAEEESRFKILKEKHHDMPPAKPRKRNRVVTDTRFHRAQKIREAYPKAAIEICTVTTDGVFQYRGTDYSVAEFPVYGRTPTPSGDYYAMDKVTVVDMGVLLRLYDQNLRFLSEIPKKN